MKIYRCPWLLACAAALLALLGIWTPAHAGPLYATDGATGALPSNLYILNPLTGAVETTAGPIRIGTTNIRIGGMTFDPQSGVLYATTAGRSTPNPRSFVTINPATGAATLVGSLGLTTGTIAEISFDPTTGILYGFSGRAAGSDLYTINPATGAATLVGTGSTTFLNGGSIAFSPSGTLYLTAEATGPLYTVDTTTGDITPGPLLFNAPRPLGFIKGLSFDEAGDLFGINFVPFFGNEAFLVRINTATGEITTVGQVPNGLDAIAFQPSGGPAVGVPEPSTLVLFGLGLLGLASCWRRRRGA